MIRYTPASQLKIEDFRTPFELNMDPDNRWVKLSKLMPWDELAAVYHRNLNVDKGRAALDARVAIGAMVIKHKHNLSDRETLSMIRENPYMQFFLGLEVFNPQPLFDPSLLVALRKRMGMEEFDAFNELVIAKALKRPLPKKEGTDTGSPGDHSAPSGQTAPKQQATTSGEPSGPAPKGKLKLDATVADIYIKYPTDLDLLNTARECSEQIVDLLHAKLPGSKRPRIYRRVARKEYLSLAKKKRKSEKQVKKGLRKQLNYLKRNFGHIEKMLDELADGTFPLSPKLQRDYWIIQETYRQQKEMLDTNTKRCGHRIVSIHQPYVRPIVRGKTKHKVEFGPKIGLALADGYTRINTLSWDAYHEGVADFQSSVEQYRKSNGHYPELVQVDAIYPTKENRAWAKEKGIRITAKPLGRPKKQTAAEKRKHKKEYAERNHVEGKIGQAKNGYRMNQVRTKLKETAESWISCVIFVTNLVRMQADQAKKEHKKKESSFWPNTLNKHIAYIAAQYPSPNYYTLKTAA
jgi:hypothetical protein